MRTLVLFLLLTITAPWQPGWACAAPAQPVLGKIKQIDPALATSVPAVMFGLKKEKIFLIDVRPGTEFARYHIAGSLNIALHAIKTKAFLKTKPIVLVNKGFAVTALANTCRALNKTGFKASIMAGGFIAWKQKHGKLIGDPFEQNKMNWITPRLLDMEKASSRLIMVNASDQPDAKTKTLMPAARHLPLLKNKKSVAALKKIIKANQDDPFARLVIFTFTGKENARIQRHLAKAGIYEAFFLQGGMQAYKEHLQNLQLARRPAKQRKITTGGCKSCAQEQ